MLVCPTLRTTDPYVARGYLIPCTGVSACTRRATDEVYSLPSDV